MSGWITPGMTLATTQSPFLNSTNVEGMALSKVVKLFHRAAAGHRVTGKKTHFSGKTITLGFEVSQRAVLPSMELLALSSPEEKETESDTDEEPPSPEEVSQQTVEQ